MFISWCCDTDNDKMQPPKPDPAAAAALDAHPSDSEEAEAFIGQDGAEGFDGEVIDDLEGEGAPMCALEAS